MGYWIVVVDDDVLALRNAKNLLSGDNLRVSCLRSGADFLKFMEVYSPDLVILDILMPEMDGFECYHALRKMEEDNGRIPTPVIFLTGDTDHEYERRGLKYGASDFVHKPYDKEVMLSRIINTINNNKTIEKLTKKATVDKLTGFYNKSSGTARIAEKCKKFTGALMLFDLDNFKLINDFYGHDMGDQVLIAFADIMRRNTRVEDVLSRIGGDEFLAFFLDLTQNVAVKALTDRLNEQLLKKCIELMGPDFDIPIGISVGASFAPEHSKDFSVLFQNADSAMYKVKQNGKHGVEIFDNSVIHVPKTGEDDLGADMAHISRILSERGSAEGAKFYGKDVFVQLYHFTIRMLKCYERAAGKMLFELSSIDEVENFSRVSERFMEVLVENLRFRDNAVQVKPDQFFVLVPDISLEEMEEIKKKVEKSWAEDSFSETVSLSCFTEYMPFEELK